MKKTEGGATTLYVNKYYEKNLSTSAVTLYYYLGDKMVAYKLGTDLKWVHQDHLTGTSVTTTTAGNLDGAIKYKPYGETRSSSGNLPAQKFTGQRLDDVGLYYYGARYYDPSLARFISADSVVPGSPAGNSVVPGLIVDLTTGIISGARMAPFSPQSLNRYSYVLNNPLRYVDPTGRQEEEEEDDDETVPPDWGSLGSATATSSASQQANSPTDISTPATPKEESPPSGLTKTNDKVVSQNIPGGRQSRPGPPESMVGQYAKPGSAAGLYLGPQNEVVGGAISGMGVALIAGGIALWPVGAPMIATGLLAVYDGKKIADGESVTKAPLPSGGPGFIKGAWESVKSYVPGAINKAIDSVRSALPGFLDRLSRYDPPIY